MDPMGHELLNIVTPQLFFTGFCCVGSLPEASLSHSDCFADLLAAVKRRWNREGFSERKEALTFFELQMFRIVHLLTWCAKDLRYLSLWIGFLVDLCIKCILDFCIRCVYHLYIYTYLHITIYMWYAHISKRKRHEKNILIITSWEDII